MAVSKAIAKKLIPCARSYNIYTENKLKLHNKNAHINNIPSILVLYACFALILARLPVTAWKPYLMVATEHLD